MNDKFMNIMEKHEKEDSLAGEKEEKLMSRLKREYVNSEEIIEYLYKEQIIGAQQCVIPDRFDFNEELMPIRHEDEFKIRKHTKAQFPYCHGHDFYEIIYVMKGSCTQEIREKSNELVLNKKSICVLSPGVPHLVERAENNAVILKMHIPRAIFEKAVSPTNGEYIGYKVYENVSDQVEYFILKLLDESNQKEKFSTEAMTNYLSLLLIEVEREIYVQYNSILGDFERYIEANIQQVSLIDFSKSVGYNVVYTGKLIKKYTNKNFTNLVIAYKIKKARKMLDETQLSINEIAYEVGYSNASGLHKQFYSSYGITPLAYRNLLK